MDNNLKRVPAHVQEYEEYKQKVIKFTKQYLNNVKASLLKESKFTIEEQNILNKLKQHNFKSYFANDRNKNVVDAWHIFSGYLHISKRDSDNIVTQYIALLEHKRDNVGGVK